MYVCKYTYLHIYIFLHCFNPYAYTGRVSFYICSLYIYKYIHIYISINIYMYIYIYILMYYFFNMIRAHTLAGVPSKRTSVSAKTKTG